MRHALRCAECLILFALVALSALAVGNLAQAGDKEKDSVPALKLKPVAKADAKAEDEAQRQQRAFEEQIAAEQRATEKRLRDDPAWQPSHTQTGVIRVCPTPKDDFVHGFCLDPEGNLLVGCGGARQVAERKGDSFAVHTETEPCELRVYTPEGRLLKTWKVATEPQAVCVLPDGTIFVGGDGMLLKLDSDGKVLAQAKLPSLRKEKPAKKAAPKAKAPSPPAPLPKGEGSEDDKQMAKIREQYRRNVTGLAVTDTEVFVVSLGSKGWGYSVWRMDHEFKHPKEIITGLTGCCGQMDIQAAGGDLWIPENGRHLVRRYDREGKKLSEFGKNDRKAADGFGGCCEPKNLAIGPGGDLFTAESGEPVVVKRFSPDGKFRGVVAIPKYKTGCVHVCVAAAPDGRVFILNPGEGAIHVFSDRTKLPTHEFLRKIDLDAPINSFCLNAQGNVLAACTETSPALDAASPGRKSGGSSPAGGIRVVSPDGKPLTTWALDFVPQAINHAADGTIYTAGSGKMAHLNAQGKLLKEEKLPSDVKPLAPEEEKKLRDELQKLQTDYAKLFAGYREVQTRFVQAQKELSDAVYDADAATTDAEKKAVKELIEKLKVQQKKAQVDLNAKTPEVVKASQAMQAIYAKIGTPGMRGTVTGIAATRRDLFVCRNPDVGYGYEVWRTDRDFGNAKKIVTNLAGCCGQMDVQADDDGLWIPENGRHQVHRYDREGKMLFTFGKNDRSAPDGFGGCCEPKNIRIMGDEIFTAESTQPVQIKHFGKDGRFLGIVAVPTYKTGCVRVCVEVSADRRLVYCLSPGENAIYVFQKSKEPNP